MSRRNRRVVAPPTPKIRRKDKDIPPFSELLTMLKEHDLSQSAVFSLLDYIYLRYEGEYRYYNRLLKDDGRKIV